MNSLTRVVALIALLLVAFSSARAAENAALSGGELRVRHDYFERKVRPLLTNRCQKCHGSVRQLGALRLDTAQGMFYGSTNGAVVVPGNPDASVLVQLARSKDERRMPPPRHPDDYESKELRDLFANPPLEDHEIEILERWVREGAHWPDHETGEASARKSEKYEFTEEQRSFWAFQPMQRPHPPSVENSEWPSRPASLDHFVLARLEAAGLEPAPAADPLTLLRRVTYDLTGLPPTPEEVREFARDSSDGAYARLVDRLLDSPRYGERWGRHWLDVARFAETAANDGNVAYPEAWRYRDWVIDAVNDDKPFNEFIVEQLAGDLLPDSGDPEERLAHHVATGFLQVGPKPNGMRDKRQLALEIADEQVHTIGVAFMGISLGCARCHDHKFDPIPTLDYYSVAGILLGTESMFDYERDSMHLNVTVEGPDGPVSVLAVRDKPRTRNQRVHIRGNYATLGEEAPRRFLQIVAGEDHAPIEPHGSGRLELARWIASPDHPLTARVAVNRVWQKHFGHGLVLSVDDFGFRGELPSHPELLDWLARKFIDSGWSMKALHREIVLSSTYRQAHVENKRALTVDSRNRLLWRMPRRRLSAEEVRDTLLAHSGRLDLTMGGPLFTSGHQLLQGPRLLRTTQVNDLERYGPYQLPRRSVYLPVIRNGMHPLLEVFDVAAVHESQGARTTTTTAPQALLFLNSPFVHEVAGGMARALVEMSDVSDEERIARAYEIAFGRSAAEEEIARALAYLATELEFLDPDGRVRALTEVPAQDLPGYDEVVRETPGLLAYYDFEKKDSEDSQTGSVKTPRLFVNRVSPGKGDARVMGEFDPATDGVNMRDDVSGQGVLLNGKGQRLELADTAYFDNLSTAISVEYWIRPERVQTATVVGRDSVGRRLWKSGIMKRDVGGRQENVVFYEFFSEALGGYRESFLGTAPVGQWTHVVLTCGGGRRQLFVNGQRVDERAVGDVAIPSGGVPVTLGARHTESEFFDGRIDEVSIYNRALDPAEVATRYCAATGKRVDTSETLRVATWTGLCHALLCTNEFIFIE